MSHRTVITSSFATIFATPDVRAEMSSTQCAEVDSILQCEEPTPKQFRELTHRLNRIYATDD